MTPSSQTAAVGGHTPAPWHIADGGICSVECPEDGSNVICLEPEHMMKASLARWPDNAALIVRAVNSHEALVDALEKALPRLAHKHACWSVRPSKEWAEHGSASYENCDCEIKIVRAALAKAEGK